MDSWLVDDIRGVQSTCSGSLNFIRYDFPDNEFRIYCPVEINFQNSWGVICQRKKGDLVVKGDKYLFILFNSIQTILFTHFYTSTLPDPPLHGEWSDCTSTCGTGIRMRDSYRYEDSRLEVESCDHGPCDSAPNTNNGLQREIMIGWKCWQTIVFQPASTDTRWTHPPCPPAPMQSQKLRPGASLWQSTAPLNATWSEPHAIHSTSRTKLVTLATQSQVRLWTFWQGM